MTYFVLYSLSKYVCGLHYTYTCFFQNEKELLDLLGPAKIAVDYVCKIYGVSVGVSVTRAISFGTNSFSGSFAKEDVQKLLEKKLKDLKGELRLQMEDFMQISKRVT